MDRKDDHRSRTQRVRSGKHLLVVCTSKLAADPLLDRSRSPPPSDRSSNLDRRRERSPLRPSQRQPSRPTGNLQSVSRGRDSTPNLQAQRNGPRRPNPAAQPKSSHAQSQVTQQPQSASTVMTLLDGEDELAQMSRIMGFAGFRSTKNTKVPGNDKNHGVSKVKKTEYRQYMNRVGGFNRPLDAA
nr:u4/u6.u5 small nuclear ribonucleoprotein 27 kda protein [Quercus suber]